MSEDTVQYGKEEPYFQRIELPEYDPESESRTFIYIVLADTEEKALEILAANDVAPKGYHCCHEHDCCGNWYPSAVNKIADAKWYSNNTKLIIFTQIFTQNV